MLQPGWEIFEVRDISISFQVFEVCDADFTFRSLLVVVVVVVIVVIVIIVIIFISVVNISGTLSPSGTPALILVGLVLTPATIGALSIITKKIMKNMIMSNGRS